MGRSSTCRTHEKAALGAVVWALCTYSVLLADDAAAHKTSVSIKQALVDSYAKRQGLSVEYRFISSDMGSVPAGQYVRRIIAADRRGNFFFDNAHGHESMSIADDPFHKISLVSPTGIEILRPLDRVVRRYTPPVPMSLAGGLPGEFMVLFGWWPFVDTPEQQMLGRKRSIEALESDDSYVIRPQTDVIDGYLCDVIEIPKVDVIWVSVTDGPVVRRRDLFDIETGALALRVDYGDYRTIGSGIQVPMSMRTAEFDYAAQFPAARERCLKRIEFQILNARSNEDVDIPAMAAAVRLPGAIQRSSQDEYELLAEGEEEYARSIVLWGRKQLDSSGNQSDSRWLSLLRPSLFYFSAGLAVGCLLLLVRSYYQHKEKAKKRCQ